MGSGRAFPRSEAMARVFVEGREEEMWLNIRLRVVTRQESEKGCFTGAWVTVRTEG